MSTTASKIRSLTSRDKLPTVLPILGAVAMLVYLFLGSHNPIGLAMVAFWAITGLAGFYLTRMREMEEGAQFGSHASPGFLPGRAGIWGGVALSVAWLFCAFMAFTSGSIPAGAVFSLAALAALTVAADAYASWTYRKAKKAAQSTT